MDFIKHTPWLNIQWIGNPIHAWLIAAIAAIVGFVVVSLLIRAAANRVENLHVKRLAGAQAMVVALLRATRSWIILLLALSLAAGTLTLPARGLLFLRHVDVALVTLQIALWASALIRLWARHKAGAATDAETPANMLVWGTELIVWSVLLIIFLGNVGVKINALIASLGVTGIAIGFAAQNILGDLFASIAIGLDKPYVVGDFINFRSFYGTVAKLGIKSTRIASLAGPEISIANAVLAKELVINYNRMPHRRIVFDFRICYGATSAQLQEIVTKMKEFIEAEQPVTRYDRGHFIAFGDSGYDFQFVYYMLDTSFALYRDVQQRVNLKLIELLEQQGTGFAIPARQIVQTPPEMAGLPALPDASTRPSSPER